jgi:magnesium-transporting ATPase (P-type)
MIAYVSLVVAGATIAVYFIADSGGHSLEEAQTAAVTMLVLGQVAYLFNCRFLNTSSVRMEVFRGNPMVGWTCLAMIVLQLIFVYAPFMHTWFASASLPASDWAFTIVLALGVFFLVELGKLVRNRIAQA